jgi:hypothetical protein
MYVRPAENAEIKHIGGGARMNGSYISPVNYNSKQNTPE